MKRKRLKSLMLERWPYVVEKEVNSIFQPKSVIHVKQIITFSEEFLTVHVVDGFPILMEIKQVFYPTVHALWKAPSLIPFYTTWPAVFERITNGADLMLPGIIVSKEKETTAYGNVLNGQIVGVNTADNRSAVAVGITLMSSLEMFNANGHGKAVKILHFYGDHIFQCAYHKVKIPEMGPPDIVSDEPYNDTPPSPPPVDSSEVDHEEVEQKLRYLILETEEDKVKEEETTEHAMDELVMFCFVKALKTSANKIDLPILCSSFYKLHMIPACPAKKELEIKKSSYKKFSKFLASLQLQGLLTVKETAKGVDSIVHIDAGHPLLLTPLPNIYIDDNNTEPDLARIDPVFHEYLSVTAPVLPIMSASGYKKGDFLDRKQVRDAIREYVKKNKLQDVEEKSLVKVDQVIQNFISDQHTCAVSWQDLTDLVIGKMTNAYKMIVTGEKPIAHKGKLEPIDMQVSRRAGNKKVTLINNLELYGIDISAFSKECQHGSAASTSISSIPGKKSKQLLVQGNQVVFVHNLLVDKYKIPKRYIRGLDQAPNKKKN